MKACIERNHTHTNSLDKSEESLKTTAKRVAIKTSVCQGSLNIHTRHCCKKFTSFFFFYVGEWYHHSLSHHVLFTILCQCAKQCCCTKWCHKESLLVFSFFTFLLIRGAVCPPSAASSDALESQKGQQGEKKLLQIQLRVPWCPKIRTCHLRNRLLPSKI